MNFRKKKLGTIVKPSAFYFRRLDIIKGDNVEEIEPRRPRFTDNQIYDLGQLISLLSTSIPSLVKWDHNTPLYLLLRGIMKIG